MEKSEKEAVLRTIDTWRRASKALEAVQDNELRSMTDDDVRIAVVDLLSIPYPDLPDSGSGLVEQQRIFHRAQ